MSKVFSKSMLSIILSITILFIGLVTIAHAESRYDMIKKRGQLIAGIKLEKPCGFKDEEGNFVGFDVDILKYIAEKLEVDIKFIPVTSSTRITAVSDGVADISAATLTHTKSRDEVIDYSITYFYDGQKILVKKDSPITGYKDLAGKKVGTSKGTTSERNIQNIQPEAQIISFPRYPAAFQALQGDMVDAITTDSTILLGLKAGTPNPADYKIVGEFFSDEPYGLALPQNDSKWRDFVNESLIEMWNSGDWLKVYNKWFGPGTKYEFPLDFTMSTWPLR